MTIPRFLVILTLLYCSFAMAGEAANDFDELDKELGIEDGPDAGDGLGLPTGMPGGTGEPALPDKGPYTIELVTWDDPKMPIDAVSVNRSFEGSLTVVHWPLDIRLNKLLVTPPDVHFHKDAGQLLSLKSRRKTGLSDGIHRFTPGDAAFEVKGIDIKPLSPAVLVDEETIRLRLVPVTFESTNAERTRWFPFRPILRAGELDLIKRFEKVGPPLARRPCWRLTMYLPAGQEYKSSWGMFRIGNEGEVEAARLARGVTLTGRALHLVQELPKTATKSAEQLFHATLGEGTRVSGPLVWARGEEVRLSLDAHPGAKPPVAELRFHSRPSTSVPLKLVPEAREADATRGHAAQTYRIEWDSPWVGPARLHIEYADGELERDIAVVPSGRLHVFTRLQRSAYLDNEKIEVRIVAKGAPSKNAALLLLQDSRPDFRIGSFALRGRASEIVFATIDASAIAPGDYELVARAGDDQSGTLPITIRACTRKSNLLVSNITICTGGWNTEPQWRAPARQAALGAEMLTRAGHDGYAYPYVHGTDPKLAAALQRAGLPVGYARIPAEGGQFLDECVRHGIGYIDYVSPYKGWYLEGLSFHHSYPPDVARWIRREQIMFGAGADYPSYWGVNYTWFPKLFGYSEMGVDTDIRKRDRNRTLSENLRKQGLKPFSREEWHFLHRNRGSKDPEVLARMKELRNRQVDLVRGYADAFREHFQLYAEHIKEVRPDGMAFAFENAGHDGAGAGNYLPQFYGALDAATMEAYTDYGDWAMEPAFTTDWVRAAMKACPDRQRPFWLAAEWLASPPNRFGYMLQAVGRRVEGTSYPFAATFPKTMDSVVGNIARFLKTYGGVQPFVEVEPEIAILCSFNQMAVSGRAIYDYHACYYELTRAQYPPQCIYQETVERGGLRGSGIKVLFVVKQTMPLPDRVLEEIRAFQKQDGLVVMDSLSNVPLDGAHRLSYSSKHIWEGGMGGFEQSHRLALWQQYLEHRDELKALLSDRVHPFAQSDDERIITSTLVGGDVRFVFAINDRFDPDKPDQQLHVWRRAKDVRVRLANPKAVVYDLLTLQRVEGEVEDGRLLLKLDLFDHPSLILAALPEPVEAITTNAPGRLYLGDQFLAGARLLGQSPKPIRGPTPVRYVLYDPKGGASEPLFRAAGVDDRACFRIGVNAEPGTWKLEVTDMVSGKQCVAPIEVQPAPMETVIARPMKRAIVPRLEAAAKFMKSKDEKLVIIEENQRELRPLADKLAHAIRDAGGAVRIIEVNPTDFGEIPLRWYLTPAEERKYEEVEAAKLIGVRKDLKSYVDPRTRRHVPSLGGYAGVPPKFIIRHPSIVFGGGRLAASLGEMLPYTTSPDDPGPGNAVLALAFSAFEARKHTLAILASDRGGYEAGIKEAIRLLREFVVPPSGGPFGAGNGPPEGGTTNTRAPGDGRPLPFRLSPTSPHYTGAPRITDYESRIKSSETWREPSKATITFQHPLATQFRGFFASVTAVNRNGDVLVRTELGQRRVLISREGKVLGTLEAPKDAFRVRLSDDAQSVFYGVRGNPRIEWMEGWGDNAIVAQCDPNGVLKSVSSLWPPAGNTYGESFATRRTSYFVLGTDGQTLYRSREGGLTTGPPGGPHRLLSLARYFRHFRETHSPDWPMAMALSEDGKTLAFSCWGHPTGANMSQPFPIAMSPETMAIDTETLEVLWAIVPPSESTWGHAPKRECLRINADGSRVGYVDGRSQLYVIDRSGETVWHKSLVKDPPRDGAWNVDHVTPHSVRMSDDGQAFLVAYASRGEILFVRRDQEAIRLRYGPSALAPDGRFVLVQDGRLDGYSAKGAREWRKELSGQVALSSLGKHGFALVFEDVTVERRSWDGEVRWRLPGEQAVEAARSAQPLRATPETSQTRDLPVWPVDTLQILQEHCGAELIAEGDGAKPLSGKTSSSALNVHLAYRKLQDNPPITLTLSDGKRREKFVLDLPAPLGRTQDIAWPNRGRALNAKLEAPADVEVSEFQLWRFQWPSKNQAYVKPAGAAAAGDLGLGDEEDDDLGDDEDLDVEEDLSGGGLHGKMKDARLRVRNPDPDQVAGPFMPAGDNPMKALNGRLYTEERISNWDTTQGLQNVRGLWLEVDFGKEVRFDLLAYYSHTTRQSELVQSIGFMTHQDGRERGLALAINNDQFLRLFYAPKSSCRVLRMNLGEVRKSYGASEIEVYRAR